MVELGENSFVERLANFVELRARHCEIQRIILAVEPREIRQINFVLLRFAQAFLDFPRLSQKPVHKLVVFGFVKHCGFGVVKVNFHVVFDFADKFALNDFVEVVPAEPVVAVNRNGAVGVIFVVCLQNA